MSWGFALVSSVSLQCPVAGYCADGNEPPAQWMARNLLVLSIPPLGHVPGYFTVFLVFTSRFIEMRLNALLPLVNLYFRAKFYCYACSVLWLLYMFCSVYSVYCLYVNVSCIAATGYQPNCSYIYIYIYISYINHSSIGPGNLHM
jgi:hypothetical protein